ncbi:hypothetical protein OD91_1540 [Lutibacter sp. Hel_I_33_5]|uniref:hypothetical protein n=1 Tax=Lutibacter sp. Hel_I_33_5 TaxID=1566289 RepID=UPI0011A1B83F|nr:hypothetical protein [Lutibacter sp. Hel_I_33_5]TVZ56258.1 hypothetical protein OD91_1540 [Lutibacter sp. Hel_I_33_5]
MKKIYIFFFLLVGFTNLYGQELEIKEELTNEEDEIIDLLLGEESIEDFIKSATNIQFLYFTVDYNNNTYFSGRDIGTDQFNTNPQISYINSNGFFAGLSSIYFSQFSPKWDYVAATVGYGKNFGKDKKYRWTSSYAKYFFTDNTDDNPFKNAFSLGLEVDNKSKTLGTELTTTYLFGDDESFQIVSSSYAQIDLHKSKNYHLKFRPQLNIIVADQTIQLAQINNGSISYITNNDFGLLNTQLQVPLQLNVSDFDFEFGFTVNVPSPLEGESNLGITTNFNFSIGYLLEL